MVLLVPIDWGFSGSGRFRCLQKSFSSSCFETSLPSTNNFITYHNSRRYRQIKQKKFIRADKPVSAQFGFIEDVTPGLFARIDFMAGEPEGTGI
ncbi:MAG: hypothetical protein QNJ58_16430 [Desulfobacterales bacterium]|nr:hypothetical protein [Desulfobacterales bacterium]